MMKIKTRLLAMLLAGFMIAETCPITAFGAETTPNRYHYSDRAIRSVNQSG